MHTVLSVVRDFCGRISRPRPTKVVNAENELTLQYFSWLLEAAREIIEHHNWEALKQEATFTTEAGEEQGLMATIAPGFREFVPKTFVNLTSKQPVVPINSQQHAAQLLEPATFMGDVYRVVRGRIVMPGAVAGQDCRFEYNSDLWCTTEDGSEYLNSPEADTNIVLLDEELLLLGMKWRYKKDKGLAYGEDFNDFRRRLSANKGKDGGEKEDLSLNTTAARVPVGMVGSLVVPAS